MALLRKILCHRSGALATRKMFFSSRSYEDVLRLNELERARGPITEFETPRTTLYTPDQKILICGDGNLSFAHSLAAVFGDASNILVTCFDDQRFLRTHYRDAEYHMLNCVKLGAKICLGVDATKLLTHPVISKSLYDVIVWNRPHCGIHRRDSEPWVIKLNQRLISEHLRCASRLITPPFGEIHTSVKLNWPYSKWNVESIAKQHGLYTFRRLPFPVWEYPFYVNKKGAGEDADHTFCNKCTDTFVFRRAY